MTRYFFRYEPSGAADVDGQELASPHAAREHARAVALDFAKNRIPGAQERIVVTDESGTVLFVQPLHTASLGD